MEFRSMKRKELQALCKKHGVPANLTNREMANRLSLIFEETEKSVSRVCETDGKAARQNVKKVRFSPADETFVFVSSNLKCTSRGKRANARGSSCRRSLAVEKSRRRVVSVGSMRSPVRASRSRVGKVVDKDAAQVFSPRIRRKSRRGEVKVDNNEIQSIDAGDVSSEMSDGANCENPQVEVAAPLRWHLRSRRVGVEKDIKVQGTNIENTRKNVRPSDAKKRKRDDTEGHLHSDDKPEDGSLAFVRAQQRKTTRHSKRMERGETDSKLLSEESEAVKSVGRITRSRALQGERASTVIALNEIMEVQGDIEVVKLGQPPKIIGRRTRKSTAQDENPPSEDDGPEGKKSDIFTGRSVQRRKTKRMKRNAAAGSKSLVDADVAGVKFCSQNKSSLDASTIEAESRKSEVLEEYEEVDCLRHISNGSGQSVLRGKHSPVHMGKERNLLVLANKTRRQTKDMSRKLGASEFVVAVDPVNVLPLRRSRRKAIPSAVLTDKEFIAHPTDRKNVQRSPYNTASEVETSAKAQSLKKLMTKNALVHNSRVTSDAPAKQKGGKASNGEKEYSEPSTEEPKTSGQSKRGIYKFQHGASMKSIVKADAKGQKGSVTIAAETGAIAKSAEMMDETLNIYVHLDVPAVPEHEGGLEKNGKIDKSECSKNQGSDGKAGAITGVNTCDFHAVNIYKKDDLAAQSGNALVSTAEKSQEVDVKCTLEELPTDSVVIAEKPTVLTEDDRGKVQDSVNRSCQALGRAEDSIPEQVSSRAQIEDMNAVSHQDASLTWNSDSMDEPSNAPLCLENKPETEHLYIGEDAYPGSVEELGLKDHMVECGQKGITERGPVDADEHTHQIVLLDASTNKEQSQAYKASEVHEKNLGPQVDTFKTVTEDVVAIQLHSSCSSAPRRTPEMLALGCGEANQLKTISSVITSLQSDGPFGGNRYTSREIEFSSEREQPEQIIMDAEDGLCTSKKTTEEPGIKQRESQEPPESAEAAVAASEVTIDKVAEGNQSADASFSLSNLKDAQITREKVREVEEGSSDIASERPLGNFTRESSGKDLSMILRCNTPVAKNCLLSYEHPLQKESAKQGKGQCPLVEECFCTFGEKISNKPTFKSESDLSSMEVGMDNKEKIQEDSNIEEDNGVHFGTDLINARDDDLKDKLQVDCTGCPDEPGFDTDDHGENGLKMQRFESGFDETGKSCMETVSAQAVGLITSVEGSSAEDKGIPSEMVALHSPNTFDHELSSCTNDVSKDSDGYEAGGNLEDEILSPVSDGNSLSHRFLDANSEENSLEVEEKSFLSSCDLNNITRPEAKTEVLIESILQVISSRKDQVLDMKEVQNDSSSHQFCGNLNAEEGADIDTITSRVACENFQLDESNAPRSCHMKVLGEIKNVLNVACNTEAVAFHECLKEQNLEQCSHIVEEGESHLSLDQPADKDGLEEVVAHVNCGPEGVVALEKNSVDLTRSSNFEFAHFESPEKKGTMSSLSLSPYGHKQEELDDGGQQEEMGNKVDKMELTASSNLNFSANQSANNSENLEALEEGNSDVIGEGNCHLPHAGGEELNAQKEALNFHQNNKGSICKVYEDEEEASSATATIKAVDKLNKEEDGKRTSIFFKDCVQFHGDESTKIDFGTTITPGVAAEDPKCNFNEVLGTMLPSDEKKIDLCDGQRGNCLRPDQKVPATLECPIPLEPISADVSIYVGTTESGLIPKDVKTDAVQFDDGKLLKRSHLDEVSSRMIEAAPNVNNHVEIVNTSHEDVIHSEDEASTLIMQENPETFNLEDGSTPAGETTMSLHRMSIDYEWDKMNSVGEHLAVHPCDELNKASDSSAAPPLNVVPFPGEDPSKENYVDIGPNAKEKSDGDREKVIMQEAHEPQEDHAVFGNASDSNHSSGACGEVAQENARDDEVASVQTDPVVCESSWTKGKRIVKHNEETHGSGRLDEPATESKQLSAKADSSSDFSLISSIGDPSMLENKFLESQVESQTFTSWEMSLVFGDNSLDSVGKLDADAGEERQRNGNAKNADNVELRIAKLEEKAPVVNVEDSKVIDDETFFKNQENREDMTGVTDDEHSKEGATFECSRDLEREKEDVTEDHCSNCQGTEELTIKNEKESTDQEVSAMIQEYMDREQLEDGSTEVSVSCVDGREKELAHVNASDRAPSDICPLQHAPSELSKEHLSFSSYANESVELGIKKEKETFIPNSGNHSPASVNLSARTDVAENVRMQQLNLIAPLTKSLDVKKEEPGKLVDSLMVGRTKARSNFIEKTPKKLLVTSDMKENMLSTKWEQVGSVTAPKTTKTRRVLEDLQRKQI